MPTLMKKKELCSDEMKLAAAAEGALHIIQFNIIIGGLNGPCVKYGLRR